MDLEQVTGSSRPAKRIETASIIGCISLETVQNEMHGGQSIPAFDYYLAPYVRKTYIEEIRQNRNLFKCEFIIYHYIIFILFFVVNFPFCYICMQYCSPYSGNSFALTPN